MDRHGRYRRWIPVAILIVGLACTGAVTWLSLRAQRQKDRDRFVRSAMQMRAEITERIVACMAMLRVTGGLFAASEHVTALEFQHFVDRLELGTAYPGVVGIGYSEREPDAVSPSGVKREVHSIIYLEPLTEENSGAIGYDMSTDSTRRTAMELARDTGAPSASASMMLHQIHPGSDEPGFLIFFPQYAGGELPATLDERHERLAGFVYSAFRARQLVETIFGEDGAPVEFALYDGTQENGALLYRSPGLEAALQGPGPWGASWGAPWIAPFDVGGRTWTMVAAPGSAFLTGRTTGPAPLVGAMGGVLSVLLFSLARVQMRAADRFERLAGELQQSEARKGAILESALDAVITMDESGRVIEWNRAAESVFGRTRAEVIGRDVAELILAPDDGARGGRGLKALLGSEGGALVGRRVETTALRADGSEFPVEISITRIGAAEHGGLVGGFAGGFTGFFRDITERTREKRRGALLMRELDHRVKNNLSTVIAILGESARRSESVPDLVRRASGRIRALAGLHEMLAAQKWRGAEVGELVARTLAPYHAEGRARILMSGEPTNIPGRSASALCMALHELATNAAKYGSLSSSIGSAEVSWRIVDRGPDESCIVITWRERGGPPVREPAQRGFGTELIENGIAFETSGRSTLEFAPDGLVCTIEIPLREEPEIVEPLPEKAF